MDASKELFFYLHKNNLVVRGVIKPGTQMDTIEKSAKSNCILMSEEYYEGLLNEIMSLQKSLLSANQAIKGEITEYKVGDKDRLKRFKK